ncbi:uncharacterized protein TNCV_236381 [Trichonephila clavipes]|nr:uncharacterized protein TNCV_236381 [Trichonephila clavipes]
MRCRRSFNHYGCLSGCRHFPEVKQKAMAPYAHALVTYHLVEAIKLSVNRRVGFTPNRRRHRATPGSSFTPTPLGHEGNLEVRYHPWVKTLQWYPSPLNFPHPEVEGAAGLGGLQEVYFSESENEDFIEGIDNQIKLLQIPSDLSCAYLKGHLLGRARDWYEIFGSALVQNTATEFTQLKTALTKNFPVVRNR